MPSAPSPFGPGSEARATLHEWLRARRYANLSMVAGVLVLAMAFWLFRERVGLVGNALGWPVLSLGLGLLVFAAAGRDSLIGRREVPLAGWLAAISYGLYLVHKAIYHLVQARWGALPAPASQGLAYAVPVQEVPAISRCTRSAVVEALYLRIRRAR